MCSKANQLCTYPAGRLKSGPKIGSTQQGRRRARRKKTHRSDERAVLETGEDEEADEEYDSFTNRQRRFSRVNEKDVEVDTTAYHGDVFSRPEFMFSHGNPPLSPDTTDASDSNSNDAMDTGKVPLSFILHPSHETNLTATSDKDLEDSSNIYIQPTEASNMLNDVCAALNITTGTFRILVNSYFTNMTFSSLFHQPTFDTKIRNIKSSTCLKALMASMFSFAARFEHETCAGNGPRKFSKCAAEVPTPVLFHSLALDFIDEALKECGDGTPSLSLLQALILTTFYQLSKGVRGKAWRYLGNCIRVAYEQNLHLIDSGITEQKVPNTKPGIMRWCFDEERRRSWWAIWEMDVFASTIRRCPTGIDWMQNKTFLPIDDSFWFNHRYHPSCFLEIKPTSRWKVLQSSRNEAAQAWFIVVNSLMKDAQTLSNPESVVRSATITSRPVKESSPNLIKGPHCTNQENLTIIDHTLRCYTIALPESLQWHGEYLDFSRKDVATGQDMRYLHASRYEIYLMTQLTKFMIYNQYAFGKDVSPKSVCGANFDETSDQGWETNCKGHLPDKQGLGRYLEAAENILAITNSCSDNHISCVKPFLASTIWLATAAQLVYKKFGPTDYNQDLIESKFDILFMQCQRYTKFWDTPGALLQNLKSLRTHLAMPPEEMLDSSQHFSVVHEHQKARTNGQSLEARENHANRSLSWDGSQSSPSDTDCLPTDSINPSSTKTYTPLDPDSQGRRKNSSYPQESRQLHSVNEMSSQDSNQSNVIHIQDAEISTFDFDIGMVGQLDNSGVADLNSFWDGMEFDFEAIEADRPFGLNGLLYDSYAK